MKRIASLLVIAVVAGACPAGAGAAVIDTKVTIHYGDVNKVFSREFRGKVKSEKSACEKGRKVKLFEVLPGPNELLAKTESKPNGTWAIGNDIAEGHFYVKVKQSLTNGLDVCRPARSEKIKVTQA